MKTYLKLFALGFFCAVHANAQNVDLDKMLDENQHINKYIQETFSTTRLIDGHTVETTQAGVLDLKISHRFGRLNEGFYNMFGFDVASMRIGLDYGITNRLTIGGGRS